MRSRSIRIKLITSKLFQIIQSKEERQMFFERDKLIFLLFLVSGFCGLLYQVVWVRMAYASFGVITPVLSVVVSVFMLGLALGSWAGGKWIAGLQEKFRVSAIVLYALTELFIGIGAFAVPKIFSAGEYYLLSVEGMDSFRYLFYSAVTIGISILPWCILMGFTFPFMMAFVKGVDKDNTTGFSHLYFANVIGAMCGTLLTALVLIELFGFSNTLLIAACMNFSVAAIAFAISFRYPYKSEYAEEFGSGACEMEKTGFMVTGEAVLICAVLFATGFISMSMEIVWIRAFTPILGTRTYSFAALLTVYLFATWVGSYLYRTSIHRSNVLSPDKILAGISVFSILPLIMNDPRLGTGIPTVLISIFPFCGALGYLTPSLIDRYSSGHPSGAGKVYAINITGCIVGPLFASYVLLPFLGVKSSLMVLAAPFPLFVLLYYRNTVFLKGWSAILMVLTLFLFLRAGAVNVSYEEMYASRKGIEVRRDYTATVVSAGQGMNKQLLVNGIGITKLTPITKMMAHLPLAFCKNKPESALVICLGMGTTWRSMLNWDIKTTAVELVPGVKKALGYYFDDADLLLKNPKSRIVIDDGRRFLKRTAETFDVITIDPPPPIEAAGSSLLYSGEFYDFVKSHLKEGGILQQWFPYGELPILQAVARSICDKFPYVRVYKSIEGWGFHFLASMSPIEQITVDKLIAKMPPKARNDLVEWQKVKDTKTLIAGVLNRELPLAKILSSDKNVVITDDQPYNEYYILRRAMAKLNGTYKFAY
jgi:spermidine synthase